MRYCKRRVSIPHPFAVGVYEVTRGEFARFVSETGHDPVVCVNWKDAQAYVSWLSRMTDKTYRLLSEAEWEYVARATGMAMTKAPTNFATTAMGRRKRRVLVGRTVPVATAKRKRTTDVGGDNAGLVRYVLVLGRVAYLGGVGLGLRQHVSHCDGPVFRPGLLKYLFNLIGGQRRHFLSKRRNVPFDAHLRECWSRTCTSSVLVLFRLPARVFLCVGQQVAKFLFRFYPKFGKSLHDARVVTPGLLQVLFNAIQLRPHFFYFSHGLGGSNGTVPVFKDSQRRGGVL